MKTTKITKIGFTAMIAGLALVIGAIDATAQGRYSRSDVDDVIERLETSSDEFRRDFDDQLENSRFSDSQKRTYRRTVENFENSVDRLRRNFDDDNNWWRSRNQVQAMVSQAQPVNSMMNTIAFRRNLERQWNRLRNDINRVAETYELAGIAGGGWQGGGWQGGGPGYAVRPPNWATGTFFGSAPDGQQIELTISSNGNVAARIQGQYSYGTYQRGNTLRMGDAIARVTRQGNGILTTNVNTGERIFYTRSGYGGGGDVGGDQVAPPSWARGSFIGVTPDGSRITLTIANDGTVTASTVGSTAYGSWIRGDNIRISNATARVTNTRRGIRTTRIDTGEVIDYTRR